MKTRTHFIAHDLTLPALTVLLFVMILFFQNVPLALAETWSQVNTNGFGTSNNEHAVPLVEFNDQLYAGTWNTTDGGELWRSSDGTSWSLIPQSSGGFGDTNNHGVWPWLEYQGYIYASTEDNTVTGGEIWRSSDGLSWSQVGGDGLGDANNTTLMVRDFGGTLYASATNGVDGGELWKSTDGTSFTQLIDGGNGDVDNHTIRASGALGDYVYLSVKNNVTGLQVWRSSDNLTWGQVNISGFGSVANRGAYNRFGNMDGYLYVGTGNGSGAEVWRSSSGTSWSQVNSSGFGDANNWSARPSGRAFNGALYVSTRNQSSGTEVWRSASGTSWTQTNTDGFGDAGNLRGHEARAFNGNVYVGTENLGGGEIWRLSFDNTPVGSNVSTDLATGVTIEFNQVTLGGSSVVSISDEVPGSAPTGYSLLGNFYDITTNASYSGTITITLPYDESLVTGAEEDLVMTHWDGATWEVVPTTVDTLNNLITAQVTSLSGFGAGVPLAAAPAPATGVNIEWLALLAVAVMGVGTLLFKKSQRILLGIKELRL